MPFEIPEISDDTRDCCAEFMIATFDDDWKKIYEIATKAIKSRFSEEIGEEKNEFIKNRDQALDNKLG